MLAYLPNETRKQSMFGFRGLPLSVQSLNPSIRSYFDPYFTLWTQGKRQPSTV